MWMGLSNFSKLVDGCYPFFHFGLHVAAHKYLGPRADPRCHHPSVVMFTPVPANSSVAMGSSASFTISHDLLEFVK